jgi:hypothetical protein
MPTSLKKRSRQTGKPSLQLLKSKGLRNDSKCDKQPTPETQPTSLNDLPPEIIHDIAEWLRTYQDGLGGGCTCVRQKRRIQKRSTSFDLSKAPAKSWGDPSWAFSSTSKRYREVVFHGNKTRKFSLGYSTCCIKRVLEIPETIRASITSVLGSLSTRLSALNVSFSQSSTHFKLPLCIQNATQESAMRKWRLCQLCIICRTRSHCPTYSTTVRLGCTLPQHHRTYRRVAGLK